MRDLLVILVVVLLVFGTKKLRSLGSDLGSAVKGFKKAVADPAPPPPQAQVDAEFPEVIESRSREREAQDRP